MTEFDWADDIEDYEYPEPDHADEDDDFTDTISCPACGKSVYSEAIACPACGFYLTNKAVRRTAYPVWWPWVIAVLLMAFVLYIIIG